MPPETVTLMRPFEPPTAATSVLLILVANTEGVLMVAVILSLQFLSSVTVALYVPTSKLLAMLVLPIEVLFHIKTKGLTPLTDVKLIRPFFSPKQRIESAVNRTAKPVHIGSFMVKWQVSKHW